MDATFISQSRHGIMDEEVGLDSMLSSFEIDSPSSPSSSSSPPSPSSSSSEFTEDTASSGSPSSCFSSSSCKGRPLLDMASLKQQLPFKRGLSKYYEGQSQSFTSFSDIKCFEDLAKPERPLKKLKCSKSCGGELNHHRSSSLSLSLKCCNKRGFTKKVSNSSILNKPPLYPHRPGNIGNNQAPFWFA